MSTTVLADSSILFRLYAPDAEQVLLIANFNGWQPWEMQNLGGGSFGLKTPPLGQREVRYQFIVDGNYRRDPTNLRDDGDGNSWISLSGNHGSLWHRYFYSEALQEHKKYAIYLPPAYPLSEDGFAVLYLAGGLLDYELDWSQKGNLEQVADTLIQEGRMKNMVIVMPDKSEAWTSQGQEYLYQKYIEEDLIGHIEATYRIDSHKGRAIEGLSIGAVFALKIAFSNPLSFTSVSSLSCPLSPEIYNLALNQAEEIQGSGLRVRLNCGDGEESLIPLNQKFQTFLKQHGVDSECYVGHGPHDWPLWKNEIGNSLQFHSAALRD